MSAFDQFESIPELLEIVLLNLDVGPLLFARQVSRSWNTLINNSKPLRRRLWYDASPQRPLLDLAEWPHPSEYICWNPFITRLGFTMVRPGVVQHPFKPLRFLFGEPFPRCPVHDTPGSWVSMLATQPTCKYLVIYSQRTSLNPNAPKTVYIVQSLRPEGLLLGELMAVLAEAWDRQQRGIDRYSDVAATQVWIRTHPEFPILPNRNSDEDAELLDLQDPAAHVKVVVHQVNLMADAAFSLKQVQPSPHERPDASSGCGFRMVKTDYLMDYRWAGWHALYRMHTGYVGTLIQNWRPFDPLSPWRGRRAHKLDS